MVTELKSLGHSRARYRFELDLTYVPVKVSYSKMGSSFLIARYQSGLEDHSRALTQNGQSGNAGALWLKNGIGDIVMTHKD